MQALEHAKRMAQWRDLPVDAYQCPTCGAWHVGTPYKALRRPSKLQIIELGERAAWNLYWENTPRTSWQRRMTIAARARRLSSYASASSA